MNRAADLTGLEWRVGTSRITGEPQELEFFVGTDVEWAELIDHLEATEPPSSPASFLTAFPAVSRDGLLGVLCRMADAMRTGDERIALRIASGRYIVESVDYFYERLARRAVVEAWRNELRERD